MPSLPTVRSSRPTTYDHLLPGLHGCHDGAQAELAVRDEVAVPLGDQPKELRTHAAALGHREAREA